MELLVYESPFLHWVVSTVFSLLEVETETRLIDQVAGFLACKTPHTARSDSLPFLFYRPIRLLLSHLASKAVRADGLASVYDNEQIYPKPYCPGSQ